VPQVVAIICCIALLGLAGFQVVLLAGVPVARFAWGGEDHYLQPRHRPHALLTICGCLLGIFVALQGANLFLVLPVLVSQIACYLYAALFFAAFILTARSRSLTERRVMLPFYVVLSALFLIIALAGHPN
jgi:drug/metabolite transporter (DMT)-like permease